MINFNSNITIYLQEPRWSGAEINMVRKVLKACKLQSYGVSLKLSNDKEIQFLNYKWMGKNRPTNVLSFPNKVSSNKMCLKRTYLGDIILSYQTLKKESKIGKISFLNHMSHLLIHGILHLKGYTHENRLNKKVMQKEEVKILKTLRICNPYKNDRLP